MYLTAGRVLQPPGRFKASRGVVLAKMVWYGWYTDVRPPATGGTTAERQRLDRTWTPKPGDRVVRHPRREEMGPVHLTVTARKVPSRALASPLILI